MLTYWLFSRKYAPHVKRTKSSGNPELENVVQVNSLNKTI